MSTLVSELITSARYDLRDTRNTQFKSDNLELLEYFNRALEILDASLVRYDSDWVHYTDSRKLKSGKKSITMPTTTKAVDEVWTTDDDECDKESLNDLKRRRRNISTTGEPQHWAMNGLDVEFDYTADQDYTITSEVVRASGKLALTDKCPYNDGFNQVLRQSLVLMGKNRQEYDINGSALIQKILSDAAFAVVIRRGYNKSKYKADF